MIDLEEGTKENNYNLHLSVVGHESPTQQKGDRFLRKGVKPHCTFNLPCLVPFSEGRVQCFQKAMYCSLVSTSSFYNSLVLSAYLSGVHVQVLHCSGQVFRWRGTRRRRHRSPRRPWRRSSRGFYILYYFSRVLSLSFSSGVAGERHTELKTHVLVVSPLRRSEVEILLALSTRRASGVRGYR